MVRLVEKISLRDVPARVGMTLLEYAEASGPLQNCTEFLLPRKQDELSAELATTHERVARALSRLRKLGAIETRGSHVRILNLRTLESVAYSGGAK